MGQFGTFFDNNVLILLARILTVSKIKKQNKNVKFVLLTIIIMQCITYRKKKHMFPKKYVDCRYRYHILRLETLNLKMLKSQKSAKNSSILALDQPIFAISKKQQISNIQWIEAQL